MMVKNHRLLSMKLAFSPKKIADVFQNFHVLQICLIEFVNSLKQMALVRGASKPCTQPGDVCSARVAQL